MRLRWRHSGLGFVSAHKCQHLRCACTLYLIAGLALTLRAQTSRPAYISAPEAQAALQQSPDAPAEVRALSADAFASAWPKWIAGRDAEIRVRLERGEEDSLVNLLMFGTSFTREPRITPEFMASLERQSDGREAPSAGLQTLIQTVKTRVDDLVRALAAPGTNERLLQMRRLIVKKGYSPATVAGREQLHKYLMADLLRVRTESKRYAEQLRAARQAPDAEQGFLQRSSMFEDRGISLDTSLLPNFAVEQALKELRTQGVFREGSVRQIAIIGPGLDFVDKDEGYDFYPPQTVQPFALIDSLARLRLAAGVPQVTTLDISSRVNEHIARAQRRARQGIPYPVQLPRDPGRNWRPEAVSYWEHFGDTIGAPVKPLPVPATLKGLDIRAVSFRPAVVARITPVDLNVITSRLTLPSQRQFDLIIATNVFVYYSKFEQALALTNIAHMLRPGGVFLCNDFLPDLPRSGMQRAGDAAVPYSDKPGDGDRIVWYRRNPSGH